MTIREMLNSRTGAVVGGAMVLVTMGGVGGAFGGGADHVPATSRTRPSRSVTSPAGAVGPSEVLDGTLGLRELTARPAPRARINPQSGPAGPQGGPAGSPQGEDGRDGRARAATGATGATGPPGRHGGEKGDKGDKGDARREGRQGRQGRRARPVRPAAGATGPAGPAGVMNVVVRKVRTSEGRHLDGVSRSRPGALRDSSRSWRRLLERRAWRRTR